MFFLPGHDFVTCQKSRRSFFARARSRSHFGDSFLRELRLALVSRLGSSESWLRRPCFEAFEKLLQYPSLVILGVLATPTSLRSLSQNYSNIPLSLFWHRKVLGNFRGPRTAEPSGTCEVLTNLARFGTCAARNKKMLARLNV